MDKNKDEKTKKLERKDEMPKCEINNNETMNYGKSNDKKEKDVNTERDIITTYNLEERQNEILDQYREEKGNIFEIITTNITSNFCYKNSVINYQGGFYNADNYATFGNNNINDNSKYIIYI